MYEWLIEPLVKKTKLRVAGYVFQYNLFPVLDICCGTGKQCRFIGLDKQNVTGLDIDLKMINYASSKYPRIPFVCTDAANIPIRDKSFKGIIISYALHDKSQELRIKMLDEAKRLLTPEGKIILVDYEQPWNRRSRIGKFFAYLIERMGSCKHFRNWRQFLKQGGLRAFEEKNGLVEIERHNIELGNSSIVVAKFA
ncbi:MAG: class I SAM-dependent methyltransferase [Candidatus Aminicenantaceae bacterium]